MADVLFNTISYLIIIAIGYFFKKMRFLGPDAAGVLMTLILNLTLPCLLINSSAGVGLTMGMVVYLILGLGVNILSDGVSILASGKKETPLLKGVSVVCSAGIDVGDFVLPFIQTFFPGTGVMILCIFNIGNTIMNSGVNYALASKVSSSGEKFGIKDMLKRLFSSVTFDAYLLILFMAITNLPWPERLLDITGIIGNANIFLVMFMIGLKLEFGVPEEEFRPMVKILLAKYGCAILMTVITVLMPVPALAKIVLCCAYFGPSSALSSIFSKKLGYEGSLSSQVNVVSIFAGMAMITGILMVCH